MIVLIVFLVIIFKYILEVQQLEADMSRNSLEYSKLNEEFREYRRDCLFYKIQENKKIRGFIDASRL